MTEAPEHWTRHPIVAIVGLLSAFLSIIVFVTGRAKLLDYLSSSPSPAAPASIASNVGTNDSGNQPAHPQASSYFIGGWRLTDGEFHPISGKPVRSYLEISSAAKGAYVALYRTELDLFVEHEIPLTFKNGQLLGDYYGHRGNVVIKQAFDGGLSLSIDPFAEFRPIKNALYRRGVMSPTDPIGRPQ